MMVAPMLQSPRQLTYYSIIPHPVEARMLMLSCEDGWVLPHFVPTIHHFGVVHHINQAMQHQLGISVTTLRCIQYHLDSATRAVHAIYGLENHSPDWSPPENGCWIEYAELDDLLLAIPEQRVVLAAWFQETKQGAVPERRRPWARKGWFDTAVHWITDQLSHAGLAAPDSIEQIRAWGLSCILRVQTTTGRFYFRAVPDISAHEPRLLQILAGQDSALVPHVLAIDTDRNWILMQEMSGRPLHEIFDVERWETVLQSYAHMQLELAGQIDHLLSCGCPDRRLRHLGSGLESLLADPAALQLGKPGGLSQMERNMLRTFMPKIGQMCQQLSHYQVPYTLEHGDFHPNNIRLTDSGHAFIDWGESSITHPFFSRAAFEYQLEYLLPDMRAEWERLRQAYLQVWLQYEPMTRLKETLALSRPLSAIHSALTFYRLYLSLEPRNRWEMEVEAALPFALKMFLKQMLSTTD
jgi:tRNA A-37 threonylcarbamoyl transferase component Bud32